MHANLSQFNEEQIISDFFGDFVGHFVDVGASSGVALSNTFALGQKGWRGLLVEASPIHFQNLVANYTHRGYFKLLLAALWYERKIMPFNLNPTWYSSLIHKDEPGLYAGQYYVPTVIAEDLKAIQPECDFLSVDIEGVDIHVFPSLMAAYPECRLVCVEHGNNATLREQWLEMFKRYGLSVLGETPENYLANR